MDNLQYLPLWTQPFVPGVAEEGNLRSTAQFQSPLPRSQIYFDPQALSLGSSLITSSSANDISTLPFPGIFPYSPMMQSYPKLSCSCAMSPVSVGQSANTEAKNYKSAAGDNLQTGITHTTGNESKTNVIVNYLPQTMEHEDVRSLFQNVGDLESCKLVRDKSTGQSLGYGFINFKRSEDAERAVQLLNGQKLQNKTIKVSLARPSSDSIKRANVYISGFPKHFSQLDLEKLCSDSGKIVTSRILYDHVTGLSKGVGFIRFDQRKEAEDAIERLDGYTPKGSSEALTVKFANSPTLAKGQFPVELLNTYMSPMKRYDSKSNGRFATISSRIAPSIFRYSPFDSQLYTIPPSLPNLPSASPPLFSNSLLIDPALATPLSPNNVVSGVNVSSGLSIFVYNLDPDIDDKFLWQLFGPFGAVQSVKAIRNAETGKCKGYGFVTMTNYSEAVVAVQSLNRQLVGDRMLQVSFKSNTKRTCS